MEIIYTLEWMKQVGRQARAEGRPLGFVPTMGALHEGHLSLVRAAQQRCSPVVVSIFVNPTQFGPSEDFEKYPRPVDADRAVLEELGVDYLFAPTAKEMYPSGFSTYVSVEGLSSRLEGKSRPGHFRGVTTVVLKLFEIVQPHSAFFGRKDAQQARIIQQMSADLNLDAEIVVCPIVREPDGLAMSSRNAYLKPDERRAATSLSRALGEARREITAGERDAIRLAGVLRGVLNAEPLVTVDYAEILDAETFEPVTRLRRTCLAVLAAFVGKTRLIDNMFIEEQDGAFRATL
ncbi:MAG TPA: pantoate--beta-alanine ligase [Candidatus Acidoferrales bacterium]|jgi:pantoate--beta-alanine ligase|nr:pantoate--beta-alanine ligase [Candidatus Acidoferrales bacterium]